MKSLFPHKIFFKGSSFGSFLPWHLDRSELPLISENHGGTVKEEKTKDEIFNEEFANCIAVNCPKLDVEGMTGCKCYPGYEHAHWANGKRCFAAPYEHKVVKVVRKRQGQQKQFSGGPNVGYNIRHGRSGRNKRSHESAPTTVKAT